MMQVKKIKPQGYCKGVILAINKCLEVIKNPNTKKPIYMLGMIIHNKYVCQELEKMGLVILEGINLPIDSLFILQPYNIKKKSLVNLMKQVKQIPTAMQ